MTALGDVRRQLETALAVRVPALLTEEEAAAYVRGVTEGREAWTADFEGEQFSLGRAWYTHLEQGRSKEYFAGAKESDANVERFVPGLRARMLGVVEAVVGAAPAARRGYCGPGIHVFPAGAWVARNGGEIHFDDEGLTPAQLAARAPAYTFVWMLQPPDSGGALRVWDVRFTGETRFHRPADAPFVDMEYAVGDLVVIESLRLHQIRPFEGARDRVSMTVHAALQRGRWETWF